MVFDMDGVLVDSYAHHRDAFLEVLGSQGIYEFDYSEFAGWRTRDVFRVILRKNGRPDSEELIRSLADAKSRLAQERLAAAFPMISGCTEVLTCLASRYRLGLATSGSRRSVEIFFRTTGTAPLFASVLSGEDVHLAKPNPEIYLRSFEALSTPAAECTVVEDAIAGVMAAKAAGARVIGIAGTCTMDDLRRAGADHTIHDLRALLCQPINE
jgi:beta-phosphoglucomutase